MQYAHVLEVSKGREAKIIEEQSRREKGRGEG